MLPEDRRVLVSLDEFDEALLGCRSTANLVLCVDFVLESVLFAGPEPRGPEPTADRPPVFELSLVVRVEWDERFFDDPGPPKKLSFVRVDRGAGLVLPVLVLLLLGSKRFTISFTLEC